MEKIKPGKLPSEKKESKLLKFLFTSITLAGVALIAKNAVEKMNIKKKFKTYKLLKN